MARRNRVTEDFARRRRYGRAQQRTAPPPPPPLKEAKPHEVRACLSKQFFPSQQAAEKHASRYGNTQEPYPCKYCGGVHLATKRGRKPKPS